MCENTFKCDDELVGAWHLVGGQYMAASLIKILRKGAERGNYRSVFSFNPLNSAFRRWASPLLTGEETEKICFLPEVIQLDGSETWLFWFLTISAMPH